MNALYTYLENWKNGEKQNANDEEINVKNKKNKK